MHDEERLRLIRERAYEIWIAAGSPEGRELDHWHEAERQIRDAEPRGAEPRMPAATDSMGEHIVGPADAQRPRDPSVTVSPRRRKRTTAS
jgi:hypothetical protein